MITNIKAWLITYDKGRPNGNQLTFYGTYKEAFRFAADMSHGWGFDIDEIEDEPEIGSTELYG